MSKKVNLSVLNRLVKELSTQIAVAESIDPQSHIEDRIVELSKAIGLASAISSEAMALMGDIACLAKPSAPSAVSDLLTDSLFGVNNKKSS